jgi:hypothetical protein
VTQDEKEYNILSVLFVIFFILALWAGLSDAGDRFQRNRAMSFIVREHGLSDSTKTLDQIGGTYNANHVYYLADSIIKARP